MRDRQVFKFSFALEIIYEQAEPRRETVNHREREVDNQKSAREQQGWFEVKFRS